MAPGDRRRQCLHAEEPLQERRVGRTEDHGFRCAIVGFNFRLILRPAREGAR